MGRWAAGKTGARDMLGLLVDISPSRPGRATDRPWLGGGGGPRAVVFLALGSGVRAGEVSVGAGPRAGLSLRAWEMCSVLCALCRVLWAAGCAPCVGRLGQCWARRGAVCCGGGRVRVRCGAARSDGVRSGRCWTDWWGRPRQRGGDRGQVPAARRGFDRGPRHQPRRDGDRARRGGRSPSRAAVWTRQCVPRPRLACG